MSTTRIIPLCSRRTGANFFKVQELTAGGWMDRPGVFPTKGTARIAIEAQANTTPGRVLSSRIRVGGNIALGASIGATVPAGRDLSTPGVPPGLLHAESCRQLLGDRGGPHVAPIAETPNAPAGRPGAASSPARVAGIPGFPDAVLYAELGPEEYNAVDRSILQVARFELEAARRELEAESGVAWGALPRVRLLIRTEAVLGAAFVTAGGRFLACYQSAEDVVSVVTRRDLRTVRHTVRHEAQHVADSRAGRRESPIEFERRAEEFARRDCAPACPSCAEPLDAVLEAYRDPAGAVVSRESINAHLKGRGQ